MDSSFEIFHGKATVPSSDQATGYPSTHHIRGDWSNHVLVSPWLRQYSLFPMAPRAETYTANVPRWPLGGTHHDWLFQWICDQKLVRSMYHLDRAVSPWRHKVWWHVIQPFFEYYSRVDQCDYSWGGCRTIYWNDWGMGKEYFCPT